MSQNLQQHILFDVCFENKGGSCFRQIFFVFLFLSLMPGSHAWGGETDFKTFRKAAQGEINLQKKLIEQDPLDFLSYFELGLAYLKLGRHEEEVQAYQEALNLSPKSAQIHYNLSIAYDHMKEGRKAIHHMQKARDLYVTKRNHRKIRTTQRQLKRYYFSYPQDTRAANSEK